MFYFKWFFKESHCWYTTHSKCMCWVHLGKRNLSIRWKSRARSSVWVVSDLPTHTHQPWVFREPLGSHIHICTQKTTGAPFRNLNFADSTRQSFLLLRLPFLTHQSHPTHNVLNFPPSTSHSITNQSSLHFACLNPISLFYLQSQIPHFSFYKFPLSCTVRLFPLLPGYTEALFPSCHHSSSVLWFTELFLFFPILILDNSRSPVENIHTAPLWSSELFSQYSSFAPQHINLFSLHNKISEAFGWLWIFCCSASPKAATSGSWNKVCTVKV